MVVCRNYSSSEIPSKIRQKYPFFRKGLNDLKLGELRVVAFTKFAKESQKTIVTLWILSTKNVLLTA